MSDRASYFQEMIDRRGQAVVLKVRKEEGFVPVVAQCHENARRWCDLHPVDAVVPGWITNPGGFSIFFEAHSVIRSGVDGELYDVTLSEPRGFVPHVGDEATFEAMRHNCAQTGAFPLVLSDDELTTYMAELEKLAGGS